MAWVTYQHTCICIYNLIIILEEQRQKLVYFGSVNDMGYLPLYIYHVQCTFYILAEKLRGRY